MTHTSTMLFCPEVNGKTSVGTWVYNLFGHPVCKAAFLHLLGIGRGRHTRLKLAVDNGMVAPPMDGRVAGNGAAKRWEHRDAWLAVDGYFMFVYENLAEPLAETEEAEEDEAVEVGAEPLDHGGLPDFIVDRTASGAHVLDTKWIQHCAMTDLHEQYQFWHKGAREDVPASLTTFMAVWKKVWKGTIKVRKIRQHSRCAVCARLSTMRVKSETQEEKDDILQKLSEHRNLVFADRAADERMSTIAAAGNQQGVQIPSRVLKIDLDGMDQSKFKVPRFTTSSKDLDLWRPNLHIVGCVVHGIADIYFASDTDTKKDSNAQQTILSRTLDLIEQELILRGLAMPRHIVFHVLLIFAPI